MSSSTLLTSFSDNEADILIEIETMVKTLASYPPVTLTRSELPQSYLNLLRDLWDALPRLCSIYREDLDYSEHIEAFWEQLDAMGWLEDPAGLDAVIETLKLADVHHFCVKLAMRTRSISFTRRRADRRYQAHKTREHLASYLNEVLQRYSRSLVIRVDLGLKQEHQSDITIETFYEYWDAFYRRFEYHKIFWEMSGYAWDIEQGVERGYHVHTAFIYPGRLFRNDRFKAHQIVELWQEITNGMGCAYICNNADYMANFERKGTLGIGMIHRDRPREVENCINALCYLSDPDKVDQYLRAKPEGRRTFARGNIREVMAA